MKKAMIVVICFLVFATPLAGCGKADPAPVGQTYLDFWAEGNYDQMYQMLSSEAQSCIDQETFRTRYNHIFSAMKLNTLDIIPYEVSVEEDHAYFEVKIIFDTDTVGSFEKTYTLPMVYEQDQWTIAWTPSLIFPDLEPGDDVLLTRQAPQRGFILDRDRQPLAYKGHGYEVAGVPKKIPNQEQFAEMLASLLEVSQDRILEELNQDWVQPHHRVPLRNFPFNISQEFKDDLLSVQGVLLSTIDMRQYPYADIFAHITGYIAPITAEQLETKQNQGYGPQDLVGQTGIESSMDKELHGKPGYTLFIRDAEGAYKKTIAQSPVQDGHNIQLTVDAQLQSVVFEAMDQNKGAVIAINPLTGEVLAMVSQPAYDPNVFPAIITPSQWKEISENEGHPFLNRCVGALYPPGSTIKPFTAAMGLEQEIITPQTVVEEAENLEWKPSPQWGDHVIKRVDHPPGEVNLDRALVWSNNIYFAWLALELGGETFEQYAESYGFGEPLSFPLPAATSQVKNPHSDWSPPLLADSGYGQGEMLINPLQLTSMLAAFANEGDIMLPSLVMEIQDHAEQTVTSFSPVIWKEQVIAPSSLDQIHPSLIQVIEDPGATGYAARVPGLRTAGKTGTAQLGDQQEIAWLVLFTVDAHNPLILGIALEVEEDQGDTKFAIALEILTAYYGLGQ